MDELTAFTEKAMKKIAVEVNDSLKIKTKVDTGNAQAQWTLNNAYPYRTRGMPRKGKPTPAFVGAATLRSEQGKLSVVGSFKIKMGSIYISNNAPYIVNLNDIYYTGFVQRGIADGLKRVKL